LRLEAADDVSYTHGFPDTYPDWIPVRYWQELWIGACPNGPSGDPAGMPDARVAVRFVASRSP